MRGQAGTNYQFKKKKKLKSYLNELRLRIFLGVVFHKKLIHCKHYVHLKCINFHLKRN